MIDQHSSLAEKFLKKGFWLYLFSFIIAPIGYFIKIIISNEISVSELGILYGIVSLITLLSSFNDFGMTESLNHFLPKYSIKNKYNYMKSILVYAFLMQVITGCIIASFFFFGADYIAENYFKSAHATQNLKIFAFFFLGVNMFQIIHTFFIAIQNTFYAKLIDVIRMSFVLITVVFIYFSDISSLMNYSYAWIIGLYVGILCAILFFYKKYYFKFFKKTNIIWSKKLFHKVFSYAVFVFIGAQAATILGQIDMQMIIYLLDTTQAGYYTNYLSIIGIPFMLLGPIFIFLFPVFSELHAKKQYNKIKLIKQIFSTNFTIIVISISTLFFVFGPIIAYILFGEKYSFSGQIIQYSVLFLVFNFLLQINFNILAGIGKVKERVKIITIALIFNIVSNIILIKTIGVYGAALATGIGWIIIYTLSEHYLGKKYKIKWDFLNIVKNISIFTLVGIGSHYYIVPILEGFSRGQSFVYMSIVSLIWCGIFIGTNITSFRGFIQEIKKLKK